MSPIEHYFENLLDMGSDIKGDPNKNALSKEVQETVEICADYVKYDLLLGDTKADMVAMLEELKKEIEDIEKFTNTVGWKTPEGIKRECSEIIQEKINALKGNE